MTDEDNAIDQAPALPSSPPPALTEEMICDPALGSRSRDVDAWTAVYEADAPARYLYFIRSGQVRIIVPGRDTGARLVEILGPGDWFGVPALAGAQTYGSRAVAVNRVDVCELPVERLMAHLPRAPEVAAALIRQLAGKLQVAHADAADLVFEDTSQRLIKTLLQFSHTAAATRDPDGAVILQITHQQLAQAVGAARETISLTLTQLRQQNVVRTGRNRLWFNPAALQDFARRDHESRESAAALRGARGDLAKPPAEPIADTARLPG